MLPTVSIQPTNSIDLGALCEAAVFFPRTRWILQARPLAVLVQMFGWDRLDRFLDVSGVTLVLDRNFIMSQRDEAGISVGVASLQRSTAHNYGDVAEEVEHRLLERLGITRANRARLEALMQRLDLESADYGEGHAAKTDMTDVELTTRIARRLAAAGDAGTYFRFEHHEGDLFGANWRFETDFAVRAHNDTSNLVSLDPEAIARSIYSTTREVVRNADGRTDLWLPPLMAATLQCKVDVLAERSQADREEIDRFQEIVFKQRSIADAINGSQLLIEDVIAFLEHKDTRRWREWIAAQRPSRSLVENYFRGDETPAPRFDSLPWKAGRLVLMTGASIVSATMTSGLSIGASAAAGVAQSAGEGVLVQAVDRLLPPWRPSQWVRLTEQNLFSGRGA